MTEGYCKLASGIILSTIWQEDDKTRILWITILALKDRHHRVLGSVPGLASVANISVESCRAGLLKLMAPDPDSRTKDHEGRRIAEVDGGWAVLNGEKYRNFMSKQERNEYQAKLMAERRAKEKLAPVSKKLARLAHTDSDSDSDSKGTPIGDPELIYHEYPKKVAKPSALKAIEKALKTISFEDLLAKTKLYAIKRGTNDPEFIPHPATWFNGERFNDDPSTWERKLPSTAKKSYSPWERKQEIEQIEKAVAVHPANHNSVHHNKAATEDQKNALRQLRERKKELEVVM